MREKRAKEKQEKEDKRLLQLDAMKEQEGGKTPGFQVQLQGRVCGGVGVCVSGGVRGYVCKQP